MRHMPAVVAFAIVSASMSASAQDPDRPVNFEIGGGYTWTLSDAGDYFGDGGNFTIGATFKANPIIGVEGLYSYNGLGSRDIDVPVSLTPGAATVPTPFSANMNMQYGTASVVFTSPEGRVRPYGLTGIGVYYQRAEVTTPGVGFVSGFCSPWWYVCVPGGFVETENIIGERSSTDFGMVFGGGVNFAVSDAASVFAEIRYHYIWGPEINTSRVATITGSDTANANGQFLPITFGIRF